MPDPEDDGDRLLLTLPATDLEFEQMMRVVDEHLRSQDLPPPLRPLRAWMIISHSLNLGLSLPAPERAPTEGVYVGADMTIRILRWFNERYAGRLGMEWGPGRIALLVQGDPYICRLPYLFGRAAVFIDGSVAKAEIPSRARRSDPIPINLLDLLDLPPSLRSSLTQGEQSDIMGRFRLAFDNLNDFMQVYDHPLALESRADLLASADHLASNHPEYALSRWSSLQASEKAIKSFLQSRATTPPRTHDLQRLATVAREFGMEAIPQAELIAAQCSPDVRYNSAQTGLVDAYRAHWAAISICGHAARTILAHSPKMPTRMLRTSDSLPPPHGWGSVHWTQ